MIGNSDSWQEILPLPLIAGTINNIEFDKIKDAIPGQNQELPETTEITKPKLQLGVARAFRISPLF